MTEPLVASSTLVFFSTSSVDSEPTSTLPATSTEQSTLTPSETTTTSTTSNTVISDSSSSLATISTSNSSPDATHSQAVLVTETPSDRTADDGLSTGAKAGIGAGAGVLGLAFLGLAGFFIYRRRKVAGIRATTTGEDDKIHHKQHVSELQTSANVPELDSKASFHRDVGHSIAVGIRHELEQQNLAELPSPVPDSYRR